MGSASNSLTMFDRSQIVVPDDLQFAWPTEDGQTYPLIVSFDRHRREQPVGPMVPVPVGRNQVKGKISSMKDYKVTN